VEGAGVTTPLTNAEKRALKARAQHLEPIVKVGHAGDSEAFLRRLETALLQHELVKIKFTDFKEQKHELAPQIAEKSGSELIAQVGNVAVYFRRKMAALPAAEEEE
jgi:RNA-binding protein